MNTLVRRAAVVTASRAISGWCVGAVLTTRTVPRRIAGLPRGRPFHGSAPTLLAVRRKRRGGGSGLAGRENLHGTSNSGAAAAAEPSSGSTDEGGSRSRSTKEAYVGHSPVTDTQVFRLAASTLLDKLERAVEPMKAKNDIFVVERSDGEIGETLRIDLGPKEGFYLVEISEDEHVFQYSSPVSGQILYFLSSGSGEWVGMDDGHSFEGIFVRDLIRQCQGVPNL